MRAHIGPQSKAVAKVDNLPTPPPTMRHAKAAQAMGCYMGEVAINHPIPSMSEGRNKTRHPFTHPTMQVQGITIYSNTNIDSTRPLPQCNNFLPTVAQMMKNYMVKFIFTWGL